MTFIALVPQLFYNTKQYGALGNGIQDDTSFINSTITAANATGGVVFFPPGTYEFSTQLTTPAANVVLAGCGPSSILQPTASFSGTQLILLSANGTGVKDLTIAYANATYSSNPAATGIQITGAQNVLLQNVILQYINGWAVQSSATASVGNLWTVFNNVHPIACAQGFHLLGNVTSGYGMSHSLVNCNADQIKNGDGFLFEDTHDVEALNLYGAISAGSGNVVHIKGASQSIYLSNPDIGGSGGPSTGATALIETGANGTPTQVGIRGGIIQAGTAGVSITAGTQIHIADCDVVNNGTYGINITGGDAILVNGCTFNLNGSAGSAGRYDFQSSTANHVEVTGCYFLTPQGTGAQQTNNAVNVTAGTVIMTNDLFYGTGYTPSNIFASVPTVVRSCPGYNPIGQVTAPAFPATTVAATNTTGVDVMAYVTNGVGAITQVQIAGIAGTYVNTNFQIAASGWGAIRIPAGGSVKFTYGSGAPAWVWMGD